MIGMKVFISFAILLGVSFTGSALALEGTSEDAQNAALAPATFSPAQGPAEIDYYSIGYYTTYNRTGSILSTSAIYDEMGGTFLAFEDTGTGKAYDENGGQIVWYDMTGSSRAN